MFCPQRLANAKAEADSGAVNLGLEEIGAEKAMAWQIIPWCMLSSMNGIKKLAPPDKGFYYTRDLSDSFSHHNHFLSLVLWSWSMVGGTHVAHVNLFTHSRAGSGQRAVQGQSREGRERGPTRDGNYGICLSQQLAGN